MSTIYKLVKILNNHLEAQDVELLDDLTVDNICKTFAQALYLAVAYNEESFVRALLECEDLVQGMPNIEFAYPTEQSLSHMAAFRGNLNIAMFLDSANSASYSFYQRQHNNKYNGPKDLSLIFLAALSGNQKLVAYYKHQLTEYRSFGEEYTIILTPIEAALKYGEISAARLLLTELRYVDDIYKLFNLSLRQQNNPVTKFLIENANKNGKSLLRLAIESFSKDLGVVKSAYEVRSAPDIISEILATKVNINAKEIDGMSPLSIAIEKTCPLSGISCINKLEKYYACTAAGLLLKESTYIEPQDIVRALNLLKRNLHNASFVVFSNMLAVLNIEAIIDITNKYPNNFSTDLAVHNAACELMYNLIDRKLTQHGEFHFLQRLIQSNLIGDISENRYIAVQFLTNVLTFGGSLSSIGAAIFASIVSKMPNIDSVTINDCLLYIHKYPRAYRTCGDQENIFYLLAQLLTDNGWENLGPSLISIFTEDFIITESKSIKYTIFYLLQCENTVSVFIKPELLNKSKEYALDLFHETVNQYSNPSVEELKELIVLARRINQLLGDNLPCCYIAALLSGGFEESFIFSSNTKTKDGILDVMLSSNNDKFNDFKNSIKYTNTYTVHEDVAHLLSWSRYKNQSYSCDQTRIDPGKNNRSVAIYSAPKSQRNNTTKLKITSA